MTEAEWLWAAAPLTLLEQLAATSRKRRLYCVACCLRLAGGENEVVREALQVAERYADGWENRRRLDSVREQLRRSLDFEPPRTSRLTLLMVGAVEAVCQPGIAFSPAAVLDGISWLFPRRTTEAEIAELAAQRSLLREIFGNPFRPVRIDPAWLTSTVTDLAKQIYESREFSGMPILADALQDAGCDSDDILDHCRGPGPHVRGCWVLDLVLGKE